MDQAASSHQTFLRHLRERRQEPDLGRRFDLCAHRIIKKRLNLDVSLLTLLQILSVTIFEKIELTQAVTNSAFDENQSMFYNQLNLFDS